MNIEIHNLFPIPVVQFHLAGITVDEMNEVDKYSKNVIQNSGNKTSVETYVLNKSFPRIKDFILTALKEYTDNVICNGPEVYFEITQSWLNFSSPGESHHKHRHANSVVSGVFYFSADPDTDKIHFDNEIVGSRDVSISIPPTRYNLYNSRTWWLPVQTGDLVLFPSHLCHFVKPVEGDKQRISLAFNVFPRGNLGGDVALTQLVV